jgi:hypothetical protein
MKRHHDVSLFIERLHLRRTKRTRYEINVSSWGRGSKQCIKPFLIELGIGRLDHETGARIVAKSGAKCRDRRKWVLARSPARDEAATTNHMPAQCRAYESGSAGYENA